MRTTRMLSVVALLFCCLPAASAAPSPAPSDDAPTLYTLGQLISRTLEDFALTPEELAVVQQGLEDGALGRPSKVDLAAEAPKLHALQAARREALAARERQAGAATLADAAATPGTVRLPAGALLQPLQAGEGPTPSATDIVRVHYEGRLPDGKVFDSSRARGEPETFAVRGVIACWTEALQAMRVGGRSRVVCPPELAYGQRGAPPAVRPNATLVFDIELLAIVR
ncbi:MAG: FKBP-type peptidyl-prolyl cis-trans isomerase [Gammaproteobacteria bacterium]|nr:FKBP-type peptidyl-prolyl cis-trans isomerase [Gammaproteobacteria bacterium]